jgi:RTX calcium-binding nonapeptide repeat (4 copies)
MTQASDTADQTILSAWQQGLSETSKDAAFKQALLQQQGELLPCFVDHYHSLKALPRRMRRALQRQWRRSLAGLALLLVLGQAPGLAATINVGGTCTLIDAITAANTDNATGGCTAGAGADTLVLAPGSTQTLAAVNNTTYGPSGLPVITSAITISCNAAAIRRVSTVDFRIFAVAFGGNLTLQQCTVSGGRLGGNFLGGGLYNDGILTLIGSTISGNSVTYNGGGVFNYGSLTMVASTISGNNATGVCGGVFNEETATAAMINSTVSNNSAVEGGGVCNDTTGTFNLTASTISGNAARDAGGGVNNHGGLTLDSMLISGNIAPLGREVYNSAGTIAANNFNLFGFNGSAGITGFTPGPNDVVPGAGVTLPEVVAALGDNGGATQTHALVAGSPALNAVGVGCPPPVVDQRGITRPQGVRCDIGSFELIEGTAPPPAVPRPPPPSTARCFGLSATIRGSARADTQLRGTNGPDVIVGLGGNDVIFGLQGNDAVCDGPGNDNLMAGRGNDRLSGGLGQDQCRGERGTADAALRDCEIVTTIP